MEEGSQEFRRPSRTSDLWGKKQIKVQQGARHNENSMGLRRAQGSIVIRARRCKPIFSLPRSTIGAGLWLAGWAGLGWLALRCVALRDDYILRRGEETFPCTMSTSVFFFIPFSSNID